MRIREIFDEEDVRPIHQQLANSATGERSPQLGRQQVRESSTRPQQITRTLDKECSQIDLSGESATGTSPPGTGFPSRPTIHHELLPQSLTRDLGYAMHSDPRWIANDQIEAADGRYVREMSAERKGKRGAVVQCSHPVGDVTKAAARSNEAETCFLIGLVPRAKQILAPRGD
jgi:hypothetical protein